MSYGRHRLPYEIERADYHLARQRARRTHPQPCYCGYCLDSAKIEELVQRNIEARRAPWEEVPF